MTPNTIAQIRKNFPTDFYSDSQPRIPPLTWIHKEEKSQQTSMYSQSNKVQEQTDA